MIIGIRNERPENLSALDAVKLSDLTFHLTGSRFFGTATEESDWDFFIEDSLPVTLFLNRYGFTVDNASYAGDSSITTVYRRDNVHIQVVSDIEMKSTVQRHLYPIFSVVKPNRVLAQLLWSHAIAIYLAAEQQTKKS